MDYLHREHIKVAIAVKVSGSLFYAAID